MGVSAKEAAELVGMTKQGIIRAISRGKLSATKDLNGEWEIEPVELFRVYKAVSTVDTNVATNTTTDLTDSLREKIILLERIIDSKDETIADLRATIEAERKVTLLLADKQQPSFWRKLFNR